MRTTFAMVMVLLTTVCNAFAQAGPVQPRPTIGLGIGWFGAGDQDLGQGISGTYEVPLSTEVRVRIEATRAAMPVVDAGGAHAAVGSLATEQLSWMTIGASRLMTPDEPASYFLGGGIGLYRATLPRGAEVRAGLHGYGGLEIRVSDRVSVSGEIVVHLETRLFDPGYRLPLGAVVRVKVGR
jgi:hypothetical protein